ncbi:hypothetical protein [Marmoricola sp. RAF53]|uniref:hypothetical protein n=1 Tax=Marmoricola sp. RAF53 TaxID=3233059 RepID=UPI003F9E945B
MTQPATRRARHLMVPGQPAPRPSGGMTITTVQRWVLASLALITIEHLAGAIVLAAVFTDESRPGTRIGLLAVATGFALVGIVAARLIFQRSPFSPWLACALLPAAVGTWLCFLR